MNSRDDAALDEPAAPPVAKNDEATEDEAATWRAQMDAFRAKPTKETRTLSTEARAVLDSAWNARRLAVRTRKAHEKRAREDRQSQHRKENEELLKRAKDVEEGEMDENARLEREKRRKVEERVADVARLRAQMRITRKRASQLAINEWGPLLGVYENETQREFCAENWAAFETPSLSDSLSDPNYFSVLT